MKIVINPLRPVLCDQDGDFHVLLRLQSEPVQGFQPTPLSLALVVDRSGSMSGNKLTEAKRCVIDLIKRMRASDQVGIVQYDDQIDTLMPLMPVEQALGMAEPLVQGITDGGSTALHEGWLRGSEMLAPEAGGAKACHVILLSDGQANRGLTDSARICEQVAALAGAGVTTTTVGLGADFNEELMTAMAQAGQGRAHYGERAIDLAETFDAELGLLSGLQWRNVHVSIQHGPQGLEVLNGYERTEQGWRLPSVAMGSECWALLRLPLRHAVQLQRDVGTALAVQVTAQDSNGALATFEGQMDALPVVTREQYEQTPNHELVERRIHEMTAAQLQLEIRQAALAGDWMRVEQLLSQLEVLGRQEPWIAASIAFARQLLRDRDEQRMSKEMMYKSHKMNHRLASLSEMSFCMSDDQQEQAFLRRKMTEGRRSRP